LSSDKKEIAFVRKSGPIIPKNCDWARELEPADQIFIYNLSFKKESLLVPAHFSCNDPQYEIATIEKIKFSPNSKILYFQTAAFPTTSALHSVNINGKQVRYVIPGNDFEVLKKGKYKNYLAINQHCYHIPGGSYEEWSLYTQRGKRIKSICNGETEDDDGLPSNVRKKLESE
jgi:hypothetical protein